jgi:hypothetical protein
LASLGRLVEAEQAVVDPLAIVRSGAAKRPTPVFWRNGVTGTSAITKEGLMNLPMKTPAAQSKTEPDEEFVQSHQPASPPRLARFPRR